MTEKERMRAGERYDALDPQLVEERTRARLLLKAPNDSSPLLPQTKEPHEAPAL